MVDARDACAAALRERDELEVRAQRMESLLRRERNLHAVERDKASASNKARNEHETKQKVEENRVTTRLIEAEVQIVRQAKIQNQTECALKELEAQVKTSEDARVATLEKLKNANRATEALATVLSVTGSAADTRNEQIQKEAKEVQNTHTLKIQN